MPDDIDYWKESLAEAAEDIGLEATDDQLQALAESISVSHAHYGEAHYSPPASDHMSRVARDLEAKYKALEQEFEAYKRSSQKAVQRSMGLPNHADIAISGNGEVHSVEGRSERIL